MKNTPHTNEELMSSCHETSLCGSPYYLIYGSRIPFYLRYLRILFGLLLLLIMSCGNDDDVLHVEDSKIGETTLSPQSSLAKMNISVEPSALANLTKKTYVNAQLSIGQWKEYDNLVSPIEIRGRGNSTWGFPKKPFQFRFPDKVEVLGLPKDKKWILLANYTDKSMLRIELGFLFGQRSLLEWTPENKFVDLYFNEDFHGTYQVVQKVEESNNRVDIGEDGYLLEIDQMSGLSSDDVYVRTERNLYNIKEPELQVDSEAYTYIQNYLSQMEEAIWSEDFLDPELGYQKHLDIDSMVDWYLINEISRNTDSKFFTSVFLHKKRGEKIKMGPLWDFDLAFGNVDYNDNHMTDGFFLKNEGWMVRLFEDPVFVERAKERFLHFYEYKDDLKNIVRMRAMSLHESQIRNYEKWGTLGRYVWPNYVYFDTYEEEVDYLVDWVDDRFEWLKGAFEEL